MHSARKRGEFDRRHNLNTRNRHSALVEQHRLTVCEHAVSFAGPLEWNKLPYQLRTISKLEKFKVALKNYFLSQYDADSL